MKVDILKEIENLRYQAQHNRRTHFDELAEYQEQMADWLQELVEIHKLQQENAEFIYKFYEEYMETHRLKQEEKVNDIKRESCRNHAGNGKRGFYGGVKYCPTTYDFLKGHYDAKAKERCFKYKCDNYKCEKCWSQPYIENVGKDTNVTTKNIKVGTKWRDEENNITFFIIEVHDDVVIIEGEIISCSVMSKEYLLKRCKCIDVPDINVGNKSGNVGQEGLMSNNLNTAAVNIDAFYNSLPTSLARLELKVYSELLEHRINAQQEMIQIQEEYIRILLARLREEGVNG